MNIQHIKRACMNARTAMILDTPDGQQWIGNGAAAYLVEGIRVDERALTFLFNMSEKQESEMYMLERNTDDPRFTDTPYEGEEAPAVELGMITYLGEDRLALKTTRGVMFIRYSYVTAIKEKYRSFTARWWNGCPLIAVYDGMFCKALIVPMGNSDVEIIQDKAKAMCDTPFRWRGSDAAADAEEQAEALIRNMEGGTGDDPTDADGDA